MSNALCNPDRSIDSTIDYLVSILALLLSFYAWLAGQYHAHMMGYLSLCISGTHMVTDQRLEPFFYQPSDLVDIKY